MARGNYVNDILRGESFVGVRAKQFGEIKIPGSRLCSGRASRESVTTLHVPTVRRNKLDATSLFTDTCTFDSCFRFYSSVHRYQSMAYSSTPCIDVGGVGCSYL